MTGKRASHPNTSACDSKPQAPKYYFHILTYVLNCYELNCPTSRMIDHTHPMTMMTLIVFVWVGSGLIFIVVAEGAVQAVCPQTGTCVCVSYEEGLSNIISHKYHPSCARNPVL